MADLREVLFASNRERQASIEPVPGDFYSRDCGFLVVTEASGTKVSWRTESGQAHTASLADFTARAVDAVTPSYPRGGYVDNVWQLATSRTIPRDVRALAVQRAGRRAPNDAARDIVHRWARALASGMEPTR